ncbi:hypothetical protein L1887_32311 [Cichorium endivia]|nr:hypothetical protein L1887_32311 [Cichorium endivia]
MAARRPFNLDEKVEVRMQDGEFAGAVYGGVIKSVWNHRYEVKMTTLTDGASGGPLNVHVEFSYLQPVPPKVLVEFKQFDFVEVWYRRGWWPAAIVRKTPFNQFHVILVDGTRLFVDESELRIHQRRMEIKLGKDVSVLEKRKICVDSRAVIDYAVRVADPSNQPLRPRC